MVRKRRRRRIELRRAQGRGKGAPSLGKRILATGFSLMTVRTKERLLGSVVERKGGVPKCEERHGSEVVVFRMSLLRT